MTEIGQAGGFAAVAQGVDGERISRLLDIMDKRRGEDREAAEEHVTLVVNVYGDPGSGKARVSRDCVEALVQGGFDATYLPGAHRQLEAEAAGPSMFEVQLRAVKALESQIGILMRQNRNLHELDGSFDAVVTDGPYLSSVMHLDGCGRNAVMATESLAKGFHRGSICMDVVVGDGPESERVAGYIYRETGREPMRVGAAEGLFVACLVASRVNEERAAARLPIKAIPPLLRGISEILAGEEPLQDRPLEEPERKETKMAEYENGTQEAHDKVKIEFNPGSIRIATDKSGQPLPGTDRDGAVVKSEAGNVRYDANVRLPQGTVVDGMDLSGREIAVRAYAWGEENLGKREQLRQVLADRGERMFVEVDSQTVWVKPPYDRKSGMSIGEGVAIDTGKMAKAVEAANKSFDDMHVTLPAAWVRATNRDMQPIPATKRDSGEPIVSRDGTQKFLVFADMPTGTTLPDGTDISGRSITAAAWGEDGVKRIQNRLDDNKAVTLKFETNMEGNVYLGAKRDQDGNVLAEGMAVEPAVLAAVVRESISSFRSERAAERQLEREAKQVDRAQARAAEDRPVAPPAPQAPTPAQEQQVATASAQAQAKSGMMQNKTRQV